MTTLQVSPQRLLLFGWLLTNVQVNITTALYDTGHTCIYITLLLLFMFFFTLLPFFWASWLSSSPSVRYTPPSWPARPGCPRRRPSWPACLTAPSSATTPTWPSQPCSSAWRAWTAGLHCCYLVPPCWCLRPNFLWVAWLSRPWLWWPVC
jgi:hypothetical protein